MTLEQAKMMKLLQDYIHQNLQSRLTLSELSRVAGYSPSQTERLFLELSGEHLFDYIRKTRLTAAARYIQTNQEAKMIDVSLDYLFDSQEGFTRAFSKAFGVSPKKYQNNPVPISLFKSYDVLVRYKYLHLKKEVTKMETKTVFVQVVERPKRKAIIKRGIKANDYFEYCDEVGCDIWGVLESIPNALYEPVGFWLPKSMIRPNTSEYVQGVEVPEHYKHAIPEGCEMIDLPPSFVMIFQGEPYDDENFMDAIGEVWDHMKKFDPKLYGYQFDLNQPRFQMEPRGYRGYIEGKPVKPL